MWDLVGNPEDRFSHNEARISLVTRKNGASNQVRLIPTCSAIQVSHRIAILDIRIRDVMLYRQSKTKVLIQTVECFNAQADLSFHCKHMQNAGFSKILVPINYRFQI